MKFSHLAIVVTLLLKSLGDVHMMDSTHVQEEFAGVGNIACAARLFDLRSARRDVPCLCAGCFFETKQIHCLNVSSPTSVVSRPDSLSASRCLCACDLEVKYNILMNILTTAGFLAALQGVPCKQSVMRTSICNLHVFVS